MVEIGGGDGEELEMDWWRVVGVARVHEEDGGGAAGESCCCN